MKLSQIYATETYMKIVQLIRLQIQRKNLDLSGKIQNTKYNHIQDSYS